ncbi:glycosyltransferase family 39 protein [Candidatus Gottesmanbacteria bacterium]|nr:glycosyltransferase family 39 protein [Candidatus Gottesmanbacteria bacterium]
MKKLLLLIFILAAILRFYHLPEYVRFLGDEGRDVLVVKRMIVDHQWTLLGPTASVGGFYTGPVYYYFMAPFLWLWRLDPVGPAVMAALFGLGTVVLIYFFTKNLAGERAGLVAAFLMAISPKMVEISRFSWNPNPVPFFAILTFLFLSRQKKIFTLLAGICLGILYQLHYTDLIFFPIVGLMSFLVFPLKEIPRRWLLLLGGFVLGDSPFLFFEIRHGFPNTRTVWEFIIRGTNVAPRSPNLIWLFYDRSRILFETMFKTTSPILQLFYFGSLVALFLKRSKIVLVWFLVGALGIGFYRGQILEHYYGYLYPLPFILLGLLFEKVNNKFFTVAGLAVLTLFSVKSLYFWQPPNNLIQQTKSIDEIILSLFQLKPYNFALASPGNSDHAYRYFLEIWGRSPVTIQNSEIDPLRKTVTDQLIVVCEQKCSPLGNPLWEVAGFGRAEIFQEVTGPAGIKIYKLIHYRGG